MNKENKIKLNKTKNNKREGLNKKFDEIFKLIKIEYTDHIYKLFNDQHTIFIDKNWEIILKFLYKENQITKEELYDVLVNKFVDIDKYKWRIEKSINKEEDLYDSMDIFEYFKYRMGQMMPSNTLKLNILEYQRNKMKIDNQEFYEEFLLAVPINISKIKTTDSIKKSIKRYSKKYKQLWDVEVWINESWRYFISIPNLFIWWVHAIIWMETDFISNLIMIYYTKLWKYFANWYRIEKIEWNTITQYKMTKKWEIYIRRIKENLEFYKWLNL